MHHDGRLIRSVLHHAYKSLKKPIPLDLAAKTRQFLKRSNFVTRKVTHTAADLPADHEEKIKVTREEIARVMQVCDH